jgi:hypothetical protein
MHHSIRRTLIALALAAPLQAQLATAASSLQTEIDRLMLALGWPEMVQVSLQRGDMQRASKAKLPSDRAACVDAKYTEQRVLQEIAAGYAEVYSDATLVADTVKFMSDPGAKRILSAVAARAPTVGAGAAHEQAKNSAWDSLTPEEQKRFKEFTASEAGKAYIAIRPKQLQVHQQRLANLATSVAQECGR